MNKNQGLYLFQQEQLFFRLEDISGFRLIKSAYRGLENGTDHVMLYLNGQIESLKKLPCHHDLQDRRYFLTELPEVKRQNNEAYEYIGRLLATY